MDTGEFGGPAHRALKVLKKTSGYLDIASSPLVLSVFRESLAMMLVNTTGFFTPKPSWPLWIAMCVHSVVGLFLTIVVLARTLNILPQLAEETKTKSRLHSSQ